MKFRLYREESHRFPDIRPGDWRWSLLATNGRTVADGSEGYRRFGDMMKTLHSIFQSSPLRSAELAQAEKDTRKEHKLKAAG